VSDANVCVGARSAGAFPGDLRSGGGPAACRSGDREFSYLADDIARHRRGRGTRTVAEGSCLSRSPTWSTQWIRKCCTGTFLDKIALHPGRCRRCRSVAGCQTRAIGWSGEAAERSCRRWRRGMRGPYAATDRFRACSSSCRNSGCGARHIVQYVSRKGAKACVLDLRPGSSPIAHQRSDLLLVPGRGRKANPCWKTGSRRVGSQRQLGS
jgi:hypothetical protein